MFEPTLSFCLSCFSLKQYLILLLRSNLKPRLQIAVVLGFWDYLSLKAEGKGFGHLCISILFDCVSKILCDATPSLLCGQESLLVRLRQKLSSNPLLSRSHKRKKSFRTCFGACGLLLRLFELFILRTILK